MHQSRSGRFGEEKNLLPLRRIQPRAVQSVAELTTISLLIKLNYMIRTKIQIVPRSEQNVGYFHYNSERQIIAVYCENHARQSMYV
jgi:hypothetical protein